MKKLLPILILFAAALLVSCAKKTPALRAGLRASSYGIRPFPDSEWWTESSLSMASRFEGASPALVWIVGTVDGRYCWLNFPAPEGKKSSDYENILFAPLDDNEAYLQAFDEAGIKVWLQVEPGGADVETLIHLILSRYAEHPCVIGAGVDVEWYQQKTYDEGKPVTDEEAAAWVAAARAVNPEYLVFVKHWLIEKMPPTEREGLVFLNDSQGFDSFDAMKAEFAAWGAHFDPSPVGFQFGYRSDADWWRALENPPADIGNALRESIPNLSDLYWVDFTAKEIWSAP
jgi:hypothetical protein